MNTQLAWGFDPYADSIDGPATPCWVDSWLTADDARAIRAIERDLANGYH